MLLLCKFLFGVDKNSIVSYTYHVSLFLVFVVFICYLIGCPNKLCRTLLGVSLLVSYFLYCTGFIKGEKKVTIHLLLFYCLSAISCRAPSPYAIHVPSLQPLIFHFCTLLCCW